MNKHNSDDSLDQMLKNIYSSASPRVFEFSSGEKSENVRAEVIEVKKTKKPVKMIAAAIFTAAAVGAGAAFSAMRGKDELRLDTNQKIIENYYTEQRFGDLANAFSSSIYDMEVSGDRVYIMASVMGTEPENKLAFCDIGTGKISEIALDVPDILSVLFSCTGEEKSYFSYEDKAGGRHIARIDNASLKTDADVVLENNECIFRMQISRNGELILTGLSGESNDDWFISICDSEMNVIKKIMFRDLVSGYEKAETADVLVGNDGYYVVYSTDTERMDMLKFSYDSELLWKKENICGDMEGRYAGSVMAENGDPVIFTAVFNGKFMHSFNELDPEDGRTLHRYDDILISGDQASVYFTTLSGSIDPDKYDFSYFDSGYLYGYSLQDEERIPVADMSSFGETWKESYAGSFGSAGLLVCGKDYSLCQGGTALTVADSDGSIINTTLLSGNNDPSFPKCIRKGADNNIYVLKNNYSNRSDRSLRSASYIERYDPDGKFVSGYSLDIPEDKYRDFTEFHVASDGTIVCLFYNCITFFDSQGNMTGEFSTGTGGNFRNVFLCPGGMYALYSEKGGNSVYRIDAESFSAEKAGNFDYSLNGSWTYTQVYDGDDKYDMYIKQSDGIYGYSISDGSLHEIINWVDSDLYYAPDIAAFSDSDRIITAGIDTDNVSHSIVNDFAVLSRADDETLRKKQQRKTMTVACGKLMREHMKLITEFNRENDDIRITVSEYDKYETYSNAGMNRLNKDLISGNVPDIVISDGSIDIRRYESLGMFADLNEFMAEDPEFIRDDYFTTVLDAYASDGKQYMLPVSFSVNSLYGRTADTGSDFRLSFDRLLNITKGKTAFCEISEDEPLKWLVKDNISEFVDFSAHTCDFDNSYFRDVLELIRNSEYYDPDDANFDPYKKISGGKCIIAHDEDDLWNITDSDKLQHIPDGEFTVMGYPSVNEGGYKVSSSFIAAIAERSPYREKAWEFIKSLVNEEKPDNILFENNIEFPVKRSVFESAYENEKSHRGGTGMKEYSDFHDVLTERIENVTGAVLCDTSINKIIDDESQLYFSGGQTADETAANIQRKVSLYLKETK